MGDAAKKIFEVKKLDIHNQDKLKVLTVKVTGLGLLPEKESTDAYWPCKVTYSLDPDIDDHMNNMDEELDAAIKTIPTAQADIYIQECTKDFIVPGTYYRVLLPIEYLGKPIFQK